MTLFRFLHFEIPGEIGAEATPRRQRFGCSKQG
jgi:hypothetical protein